jgi:hypothetical protein
MAKTLASQARDGGSIPLARSDHAMPHWNDLTPDQCADVRVVRDVVGGLDGRWPLDGIGVAQLRPLFGADEGDPMYDGWEVGADQVAALKELTGRDVAEGATVEATGVWAARLALEGDGGYLFLELLDHRRIGQPNDGTVLIEVNLSLFGPYVCVLPWFSAPADALDRFAAGEEPLALEGLELDFDGEVLTGRITIPKWADVRFGPLPCTATGTDEFRAALAELG